MASPLLPEEYRFRLDKWIERNCTVIEQNGVEWIIVCPWCGREKLAVNVERKAFRCFTCPLASSRPIRFVAVVLNISWTRAQEVVAQHAQGFETGPVHDRLEDKPGGVRPDSSLPIAPFPWTGPLGPPQIDYLARRRISLEHAQQMGAVAVYDTGCGSRSDRMLAGRVLFPIWNLAGQPVSWATRALTFGKDPLKVMNLPRPCDDRSHAPGCACVHQAWGLKPTPYAATSGEVVLGLHWLEEGKPAYIVEGVTGTAACGPQFCATLGAHMTEAQAILIARSGVSEGVFLWDPDEAGMKGVGSAAALLGKYIPTRIGTLPPGVDAGDVGRSRALDIAHAAPGASGISNLGPSRLLPPRRSTAPKPIVSKLKQV